MVLINLMRKRPFHYPNFNLSTLYWAVHSISFMQKSVIPKRRIVLENFGITSFLNSVNQFSFRGYLFFVVGRYQKMLPLRFQCL